MAEQRAEVEAILANPEPATFENTLVPLERSGQLLERVARVFFNKSSADSNDVTNGLEEKLAPVLAAHHDEIALDKRLFDRIDAVFAINAADHDPEERYLVERWHVELTLAGAGLDEAQKDRLRELNQRLSTLTTKFEKNLLADTNELAVHVDDASELDGLDDGELSAAREAAKARDLDGYLITLVLPTGHPYLASLTRHDIRDRILTASRSRGSRGGDFDNREVLLEIVRLRAERAKLLGFPNHAAVVTADETAGSPEAVAAMLGRLAPAAARNAIAEEVDLQRVSRDEEVAAADWAYWTEKVRQAKYDIDTAALRPFFEAERVLQDGVFFAAEQLYGVRFTERPDLVPYHPDARVFEVTEDDGSPVGLYVLDLYTRDSKRGGAWMDSLVTQSRLLDHPVVVVNNLNVPKPAEGQPTLLTFDEVSTFFHEFGHALHGLFARVTYPKLAGTNVYRDFVEFPSQVNEMWMLWPEVLDNYARHHETGAPIDPAVVERIRASEQFNQGFATSEYLAAALLDQAWHTLTVEHAARVTDVAAFEAKALEAAGLLNPVVPTRYSSTYFAHVFAGGYDAGYYSYIWSEVLDADTVEWFKENGGLTRENGDRFRRFVLGVGGLEGPARRLPRVPGTRRRHPAAPAPPRPRLVR